jgi:hypothetical protein
VSIGRGGTTRLTNIDDSPFGDFELPSDSTSQSLIGQYIPYYIECLQADEKIGARYFLSDEGKMFLVPPIEQDWTLTRLSNIDIPRNPSNASFMNALEMQKTSGSLYYGYPLYVDWIKKSAKGWSGGFVVPIFLKEIEYSFEGTNLQLRMSANPPVINGEFISKMCPTLEEQRHLFKLLGILSANDELPADIHTLANKISELNILTEIEKINPEQLTKNPELMHIHEMGLYNRALIIIGDTPKFTAGLERELDELQKPSLIKRAQKSSLNYIFSEETFDTHNVQPIHSGVLESILPLNKEQKEAVKSAFSYPLTVITGPPGTGKSQVVTSILANAYIRGQRTLFTSRNHKAISVVEERINSLSKMRLMVRIGTVTRNRNLATEVVNIIDQLVELQKKPPHHLDKYMEVALGRINREMLEQLRVFKALTIRLQRPDIKPKEFFEVKKDLKEIFRFISFAIPLWCVTNLSASSSLPFDDNLFDLLVIDESSQCDIPSAIPLLYRSKRTVIIGDPHQLRHICNIDYGKSVQIEKNHSFPKPFNKKFSYVKNSLYDRAAFSVADGEIINLKEHFRCHRDIIAFSNKTWYEGMLDIRTDHKKIMKGNGASGIGWTHVKAVSKSKNTGSVLYIDEAVAIANLLEKIIKKDKFTGSVGVVSPFRKQAGYIRNLVNNKFTLEEIQKHEIVVDTAHGFQGDERDIILLSPCIGDDMPLGGRYFLSSTSNLFNVAITRARMLLQVVGDFNAAENSNIDYLESFTRYLTKLGRVEGI